MVLGPVTLTRSADVHYLCHDAGRFVPAAWERFRAGVPASERDGDLAAAYFARLHEAPDPAARRAAAVEWCAWEDALAVAEGAPPNPRYDNPAFRITFARLVTHYFHHHAWLDDDQLLRDLPRLADIPAALVHGRHDVGGPPAAAEQLARSWPGAELHLVDSGHNGAALTEQLVAATRRFAHR